MPESKILIETDSQQIPFAQLSHKGKIRQNNEDRLSVRSFITHEQPSRNVLLAVLSDGVGGHRAGEVAAQIGIDAVAKIFGTLASLDDPNAILRESVIAANLAVLEASAGRQDLEGMGATCICALIIDKTIHIANLGDSRAYLLRKRTIQQLSFDHTWLEETTVIDLSDIKGITRDHPLAHVLSRYLGSTHPAPVDLRIRPMRKTFQKNEQTTDRLDLIKGDRILICSDGLTDMLNDEEISTVIKGRILQKSVQQLVICALEKGGHDNVSVILIEIN